MRVLVCGGRDFGEMPRGVTPYTPEWNRHKERAAREVSLLNETLSGLSNVDVFIHGAARGADLHAARWAKRNGVRQESYPADWKRWRGAAGPIRNQRMLIEGRPDLVVAFPGGRGTADMVDRARKAVVPVIEVAA